MKQLDTRLDNRIVIVSGAGGGGMGTSIVRHAAHAGATVIAADFSEASMDKHIAPLMKTGLPIVPVIADVLSEAGIETVLEAARAAPGALHGLVTVVGGTRPMQWESSLGVSRTNWHDLLTRNLDSMFFITQAVARELRKMQRPGSLVAIASFSGVGAAPFVAGYGAAKAAIMSVTRSLGLELARDGIRVNAIAPGAVATPAAIHQPDESLVARTLPLGRQASPDEIGATALFLLSDMAGSITGQSIIVDGGTSLRWSHLAEDDTPVLVTDTAFKARLTAR